MKLISNRDPLQKSACVICVLNEDDIEGAAAARLQIANNAPEVLVADGRTRSRRPV